MNRTQHTTGAPHGADMPSFPEARLLCLEIIEDVLDRRQALDSVLERKMPERGLSARDRAFVRMIAATCLRRLGQIDDFIRRAADRPAVSPPRLAHILRIGAAQIAFMDVPDYAAVDTAVALAEEAGHARQKGFVNAVLRRIAAEHAAWRGVQDEARLNMPDWLMKTLAADYGQDTAARIAAASLAEAPLDITVKDPAAREHWARTLGAVILPTGTLRRPAGGAVQDLPGFADGMWWVQDAAAALPALLFGDVRGKRVIDLCAAPGGKTAQLAAAGALVTAVDRSASRVGRLADNLSRLRLESQVRIEMADSAIWRPPEAAELVLLDAPCTATGTARRHPDVLRLKTEQDMKSLAQTQARLLDNAVEMLAPGGILVYCTCSLQKDEGERQIRALFDRGARVRKVPVAAGETGGLQEIATPDGDIRALPFHMGAPEDGGGGMDGFFVSRLRKT